MSRSPLHLAGVPQHFNLPWHLAMDSDCSEVGLGDLDRLATTSFASRRAMEPDIASLALDTLDIAGLR